MPRLRCQHCPAGTLGCTGSSASAVPQGNWDNWEMHAGLDFSSCLGMRSIMCLWRRNCHVLRSKNNTQSWGNRTDGFKDRWGVPHAHTPGPWGQGAWSPRHSLLGIFPVGLYPNLQVSKNPYRNPVLFLDCTVEAAFPGTRSLQKGTQGWPESWSQPRGS